MNEKEIAFIVCANDEMELAECQHYINRLRVPQGYTVTFLAVWEAPSMTSGYQEGMESSNAKYKVYLHQDVFIINEGFLEDILLMFEEEPDIGMIGCIGTIHTADQVMPVQSWSEGKVYHNLYPAFLDYQKEKKQNVDVQMLDGLLLATQCDIPWRTDIFTDWDFYDISQCMEMKIKNKRIVVPYQEIPWCYHDNKASKMEHYHRNYEAFLKEYYGGEHISYCPMKEDLELEYLEEQLKSILNDFIDGKNKLLFCEVFQNEESRRYIALRDYRLLSDIERVESEQHVEKKFWEEDLSRQELFQKIRYLKFLIKRLEYDAEDGMEYEYIKEHFSNVAVSAIVFEYVWDQEKVAEKIRNRFF